jgi:hypothetical protein
VRGDERSGARRPGATTFGGVQDVSWERAVLIGLLVFLAGCHYVLAWYSLQDLTRRTAVRGGNRTFWGLFILIVPLAGALVYGMYGPQGFLSRDRPPRATIASLEESDFEDHLRAGPR